VDLTALAAPAGEAPDGRAFFRLFAPRVGGLAVGSLGEPNVTCVVIHGGRAVVGFTQRPPFPEVQPYPYNQYYAFLLDGGPGASADRLGWSGFRFRIDPPPPADCPAFPDPDTLNPLASGDVEVRDLTPAPTS
jgi:hypothetical protein